MLPPGAPANGIPRPPNGVPQVQPIRSSQVGISQQQRMAAAMAHANARMSPPQMSAAQVQYRTMAAPSQGQALPQGQVPAPVSSSAQSQVHTPGPVPHSNASAALSAAAPALSAAHLSPSFSARATSSSPGAPHRSPPLPAASPANVNVPRPPSVPGQPAQGLQANSILQMPMAAQYYLQNMQNMQNRFTTEQIQAFFAQVGALWYQIYDKDSPYTSAATTAAAIICTSTTAATATATTTKPSEWEFPAPVAYALT